MLKSALSLSLSHSFYPSLTQPSCVSDKQTMRNVRAVPQLWSLRVYRSLRPVVLLKASDTGFSHPVCRVSKAWHSTTGTEWRDQMDSRSAVECGSESVNSPSSDFINCVNMFLAHMMMNIWWNNYLIYTIIIKLSFLVNYLIIHT